jgi:hypothetical protein
MGAIIEEGAEAAVEGLSPEKLALRNIRKRHNSSAIEDDS